MLSKVHKNAYLGPELIFTRSRSRLGTLWCALPQQPRIQRLCNCETPIYVHCTFEPKKGLLPIALIIKTLPQSTYTILALFHQFVTSCLCLPFPSSNVRSFARASHQ